MIAEPLLNDDFLAPVVPTQVSEDDYLRLWAEQGFEFVEGALISLSPITSRHFNLVYHLQTWFRSYFELRPIGLVFGEPFVVKLPHVNRRYREPDIFIVLNERQSLVTATMMRGAPDLIVEVVSEESAARDRGEKFVEYERSGVSEYWMLDEQREDALFYRLDERGFYKRIEPDATGVYRTPLLPGLALRVSTIWEENLPGPGAISAAMVQLLEGIGEG